MRNLFNDDALIGAETTVTPDFAGPVDEHGIWTAYETGPGFRQARAPEDYVVPREFLLSLGLRF